MIWPFGRVLWRSSRAPQTGGDNGQPLAPYRGGAGGEGPRPAPHGGERGASPTRGRRLITLGAGEFAGSLLPTHVCWKELGGREAIFFRPLTPPPPWMIA